jgi:hypothetical protein
VVAAVMVTLPFLDRLRRKGGPSKTVLAPQLVEMIAVVTGQGLYVVSVGPTGAPNCAGSPPHVTPTRPLRSNASLWHVHPVHGMDAVAGTCREL